MDAVCEQIDRTQALHEEKCIVQGDKHKQKHLDKTDLLTK